jgi:polar amino acid transport system permease protein
MRWGQIATGAIAISALAFFALIIGQSQSIQWSEIPRYLVDPARRVADA